jgi:type I restriction enzyme M protein
MVLKKSAKRDSSILFIDSSKLFDKVGNKNVLSPKYRKQIIDVYTQRKDISYLCKLVSNDEVLNNKSNLSVSSYVEKEDTREVIDINSVNARLRDKIVPQGVELRKQVDEIIANL